MIDGPDVTGGPGESPARAGSDAERTLEGRALGSPLRLKVTNADALTADKVWAVVVDEFEAVDRAMSGYRADSAITRLNEQAGGGEPVAVEPRLYDALALCCRAWRDTGGRFDPRVLDALQRLGRPGPIPVVARPTAAEGDRAWIRRDPRRRAVTIAQPLDLHGIGKGLALRWAWRRLVLALADDRCGVLLEAGGDLVGRSPGPAEPDWLLAVEDPRGGPGPMAVIALDRGAVCTSSTMLAAWSDPTGRRVHHLIDPTTGQPGGEGLLAVTVAAPDPAWAEVWTKALFLAGRAAIGEAARGRGLAAWWVTDDGTLEMTPAARQRTRWP